MLRTRVLCYEMGNARVEDSRGAQISVARRSLGRAAQTPRARSSHGAPGRASRGGP